jgi:hypothetical protein
MTIKDVKDYLDEFDYSDCLKNEDCVGYKGALDASKVREKLREDAKFNALLNALNPSVLINNVLNKVCFITDSEVPEYQMKDITKAIISRLQ